MNTQQSTVYPPPAPDPSKDNGSYSTDLNPSVPDDLPQISPKPGFQTSQGQITGIVTLVCLGLSLFGYAKSPEQIYDWIDKIEHLAELLGPLLLLVPIIISYINSRGKIASNAMWASASISNGGLTSKSSVEAVPFAGGLGKLGKIVSTVGTLGGIAGPLLPGRVGEVVSQVSRIGSTIDDADIASEFEDYRTQTDKIIGQVQLDMNTLSDNDKKLNDRIKKLEAK